jgi:hypothetical protein
MSSAAAPAVRRPERNGGQHVIPVLVTREFMCLLRPVLVAVSLADLRGSASGVVELPLHLFWSSRDSRFSLDDPSRRRELYRTVLREARSSDDLANFLNGGTLTALWTGQTARTPVPPSSWLSADNAHYVK